MFFYWAHIVKLCFKINNLVSMYSKLVYIIIQCNNCENQLLSNKNSIN